MDCKKQSYEKNIPPYSVAPYNSFLTKIYNISLLSFYNNTLRRKRFLKNDMKIFQTISIN